MLQYENKYLAKDKKIIVGIDEAGRGPLAGPVACASVVMPLDDNDIIQGVDDSKKLSKKKREMLYDKIIEKAIAYKVVMVNENVIDEINILNATKFGMMRSVAELGVEPNVLLVDAVELSTCYEYESIIKGDSLSYSIACASILAKVTRDRYMEEQSKIYPNFSFAQHKGYGTKKHIEELKLYGPTKLHRKTFIKNFEKE